MVFCHNQSERNRRSVSIDLSAMLPPPRARYRSARTLSDSDALSFLWEQSGSEIVCQHVGQQVGGLQRSGRLGAAVTFRVQYAIIRWGVGR